MHYPAQRLHDAISYASAIKMSAAESFVGRRNGFFYPVVEMKNMTPLDSNRAAKSLLTAICIFTAIFWSIDRFWLYHQQARVLQPQDYTVRVDPAASAISQDRQLSEDGKFAVEVTTRGTSYAMRQENELLLFVSTMAIGWLIGTWFSGRFVSRQSAKPASATHRPDQSALV